MTIKKKLMLLFIISVLLYIGFNLSSIFQKESINDISFSDFRNSIGPLLSGIAMFLNYRTGIKKEKTTKQDNL